MTIKDIARLANVSPTTVSQVLNRKDENISEATRKRVLEIAKKYNYRPYGRVRSKTKERNFVIGFLLPVQTLFSPNSLLDFLSTNGYSSLLRTYRDTSDFAENLSILAHNTIDGLVLATEGLQANELAKIARLLDGLDLHYEIIDFHTQIPEHMLVDYYELATRMTNYLLDNKHNDVLCVSSLDSIHGQAFYRGYSDALALNQIAHKNAVVETAIPEVNHIRDIYDAMLVLQYEHAEDIYNQLLAARVDVPSQVSILTFNDIYYGKKQASELSRIVLDYEQLAKEKVRNLLAKIEKLSKSSEQISDDVVDTERVLDSLTKKKLKIEGNTVKTCHEDKELNILTVGPINIDYYYGSREIPQVGETTIASSIHISPGGKGLNQSIAVSKLGVKSILLGALGDTNDVDSHKLTKFLNEAGVNISRIAEISGERSGSAFINVLEGAESSIVVYPGANDYFGKEDLQKNEDIFASTRFCLLQTEFKAEIVLEAAKMAKLYGVKTILKPCAVEELPAELYPLIDILVPNEKEAERLLPRLADIEAKAEEFQRRGVGNVIITLGSQGCFYLTEEQERGYSKTLDVVSVDTTGASDAFIATIAVKLIEGKSLVEAVRYANIAAAVSTQVLGVSNSFVDAASLETLVQNIPCINNHI